MNIQEDAIIKSTDLQLLVISSAVVLLIFLITVIILFQIFQRRKISLLNERNAAEKKYIKEVAQTKIEVQEQTLKNVSWELHDNIGQLLSVARMQLHSLIANKDCGAPIREISELVGRSLTEIRSLSKSLNNEVVQNLGLVESIENDLDRFERMGVLEARMSISGIPWEIPANDDILIYRIVQEFFSNVLKHSKAKKLKVKLLFDPQNLSIKVCDDGIGYSFKDIKEGSGLLNMKSRSIMLGTTLNIDAVEGKGTCLRLNYPNPIEKGVTTH